MFSFKKPLVSIGIPTCNRIQLLQRTFSSLINQSYENIEIIISDNASADGTEELVNLWKGQDSRIVYVKHSINQGVYRNYDACRQLAMGRYFLWVEPGEEIAKDVLETYVSFMELHPAYVSVIQGKGAWGKMESGCTEGLYSLEENCPNSRVQHFYTQVKQGTLLYGLHRNAWIRRTPMKLNLVGDWHFIAGIAYLGKIKVLPGRTSIHTEEPHTATPLSALVKIHGFARWWQWIPSIKVGLETFWVIASSLPVYKDLNWRKRYGLAIRCAYRVWVQQQRSPQGRLMEVTEPILARFTYLFAWKNVKELRSKSL